MRSSPKRTIVAPIAPVVTCAVLRVEGLTLATRKPFAETLTEVDCCVPWHPSIVLRKTASALDYLAGEEPPAPRPY